MDAYGNKIEVKPEEFKIKGKKQINLLILSMNDNSIIPEKHFYYNKIIELKQYKKFLDMLFCNEQTKVVNSDYNIEELKEIFKDFKNITIQNKINFLNEMMELEKDDILGNSILKKRSNELKKEIG